MRIEITDAVIPVVEIIAETRAGTDGAICVFDGIVRDNTRGRRTLHLDYEAYREMALERMRGLAAEAVTRFGVRDVALVHRLGRLVVGETSALVVVASAHRGAAFDACRWLIETLK
jgi:molybdopterin synthase catalytic subunit